jgi:peptidoglycan/xylan/chitin deacetylase (PgdA/CDA1 family)
MKVAITLDLHHGDEPDDILLACEFLGERGVPATFFIPSSLLETREYGAVLRRIPAYGHEVASHTHLHDGREMAALVGGGGADLDFLEHSRSVHEDAFGERPVSFRSPAWCFLGPAAIERLSGLGYRVDSSATPQRLGIFSSAPWGNVWTYSPRRPYPLTDTLLEVPTSSFLFPAGNPTFATLRRRGSLALVGLLAAEAKLRGSRVLNLQFHPADFTAEPRGPVPRLPWPSLRDFMLRPQGGFGFRYYVRCLDPMRAGERTRAIFDLLGPSASFVSLAGVAGELTVGTW